MICKPCGKGKHAKCKAENAKRDYPSCDCQHRENVKHVGS